MASYFQAAPLVASPSYPNSIAWSEENLVAIASGHLVTILNPTLLVGPRGLITLPPNKPFPIGVVKKEDLLTPCLQPICLSRETRPCTRSLSWSPLGFAPNSGCLLAVCTTAGRVKLYRQPFSEFCAEWVEVMDISDMLHCYLETNNCGELSAPCGELSAPSTTFPQDQTSAGSVKENACNIEFQDSVSCEVPKHRKRKASIRVQDTEYTNLQGKEPRFDVSVHRIALPGLSPCDTNKINDDCGRSGGRTSARGQEDGPLPLITARQYASRSALMSSLIVAWSPKLLLSRNSHLNCFSNDSALLAVGGKSGNISFWRFTEPEYYTIEHGVSVDAMPIGLVQAHNSWITAISWAIFARSSSEFCLVLASGSSDGSVKVWLANVKELLKTSETIEAPFSLFKEVPGVTSVPISTISLVVPEQSLNKVVLAIGKGSGSVEAWICDVSSRKLESAGVYDAHDQVVTGLAWAFGGRCLYSCSQDNSLHSWIMDGNSISGVPFSSKFPGLKNSSNRSQVSDHCFGLALSCGDLIIAVVRSFDASLLNPMYQARTQKAEVEFFWIGCQPLAISLDKDLDCDIEVFSGLTKRDLICWESNMLWYLKCYNNINKVLLLWDVITALLAFKDCGSPFVENLLCKWISNWFSDLEPDIPIEKFLSLAQGMLSRIDIRKMHLLNIICRRLMLGEVKADEEDEEERLDLWNQLLMSSERELQARLVAFNFRALLSCGPSSSTWSPSGVAQMKRWVLINSRLVQQQLNLLESKVGEPGIRGHSLSEDSAEETCGFCSALVPFESPGVAWCKGVKNQEGSTERHKLARCAVSMQLCSIIVPMWFCICCRRLAATLAPETFFTMPKSPLDVDYDNGTEKFTLQEQERLRPLCPFCGILLQRLQPEFLLSTSPV